MKTPILTVFLALFPFTSHAAAPNHCESALRLVHADDAYLGKLYDIGADGKVHVRTLGLLTFRGRLDRTDDRIELSQTHQELRKDDFGNEDSYSVTDFLTLTLDDQGRVIKMDALNLVDKNNSGVHTDSVGTKAGFSYASSGACVPETVLQTAIEERDFGAFVPSMKVNFDRQKCQRSGEACFAPIMNELKADPALAGRPSEESWPQVEPRPRQEPGTEGASAL